KPARNADHPTMKPVELFCYLIRNSCPSDGLVLDPFGGSGTALVAAEQTGRAAALVELDPRYCDVIVARFEAVTRRKAERLAAGAAGHEGRRWGCRLPRPALFAVSGMSRRSRKVIVEPDKTAIAS